MSRALKLAGVVGAAGAGYYIYQAGGSPKVAEKQFESTFSTMFDSFINIADAAS